MKSSKILAMDFNNNIGNPTLLLVSLVMWLVGINVTIEAGVSLIDGVLTIILKLVPVGALGMVYFTNKEKIDGNVKKTFSRKRDKKDAAD